MRIALKRFVFLLGVWLIITGADPGALLVGLVTAAVAVVVLGRLLPHGPHPVRAGAVLGLVPMFLLNSLRGGVDVAWRAFHPRVPVRPGWIEYPLRLPPGAARVSLGNFLSLMPGTLAAGEHHDALYVHALDTAGALEPRIAMEEARIGRTIGVALDVPDV
jgi:multicomponent Na+:H+ antiporter subunit E